MISQEHFIGYVTTTLNNTFTNNFETNGAPYPGGGLVTDGDDRRINDFWGFDSGIFGGGKENCKYFNLRHPKKYSPKKKFPT